jgi:hypothetical protein
MLPANRRLELDGSHFASPLVAIALRQIATGAVPHKKQPIPTDTITNNNYFYLLLLQRANVGNDGFRVVCGQSLYRGRVLRGSGYSASQIGIRLFLFIVRNKARSLHRGLAGGIRAVAGCAFCFVESGSVVSPGQIGDQDEHGNPDYHYQLCGLHDFVSSPCEVVHLIKLAIFIAVLPVLRK